MPEGISFVICTHNGAARLAPTLAHLAAQEFAAGVERELLVVDNASTDDTCAAVRRHLAGSHLTPRVVHEPVRGTALARRRGLLEARYDYVTFVDDDNWLTPGFGQLAFEHMRSDRAIALVCGRSEPVFESAEPPWFAERARSFAVGSEFARAGDVTDAVADWWTAGITMRKPAWDDLIEQGFRPLLRGRDGTSLGAGEDTEMCLALLLAGWRAIYDPRLVFRHWMPAGRLTFAYACRLSFEAQAPVPTLLAYRLVADERDSAAAIRYLTAKRGAPAHWTALLARIAARLPPRLWAVARHLLSGRPRSTVLMGFTWLGTVVATLRFRSRFDALVGELREAPWLGGGPERVARKLRPAPVVVDEALDGAPGPHAVRG